ncbi:pre-mRNA-splicing factor Cwc21 [Histoplasma capsulatum var. duboisii H88]|uniref:Pre-mRNA-splicing factor Cwc21 n=2 Tax=Ajellomyces capsulatus TaxID=5037 RepID=F0UV44_AJEC8|nr:pre-mRNA-splicing factor CWC21 [Histoplasma capsulatum H143]EGC49771.1 pre-mRNA-splicing factor Cwc21 [Histoplasma capsulatum var. duboisii H88]
MSSNVGLSTPRGSGTSGYVQRNLSFLKPRDAGYGAPYPPVSNADQQSKDSFKQRQPDKQILEHDRRRAIEVKILEERDRLEEANEQSEGKDKLSEEAIEERLDAMRKRLVAKLAEEVEGLKGGGGGEGSRGALGSKDGGRKQFKTYQVHELAEAKIEESERLRRALGIRGQGEQGDEWRWGAGGGRRREERERERGNEKERDRSMDRDRNRDRDRDPGRDGYQSRSRRER